jgi:CRISPR/Cas system-associated exonuclease Cas4 (RecB family)
LVPGERGWILADYKSSEITALEVPAKLESHELQLQLYALALRSMGLEIEQALVIYLAPEVISTVDISSSTLDAVQELVERFAKSRRDLDLPPTPGPNCRHCPWSEMCPESNSMAQLELSLARASA